MQSNSNPVRPGVQRAEIGRENAIWGAGVLTVLLGAGATVGHADGLMSWGRAVIGVGLIGASVLGLGFWAYVQRVEINKNEGTIRLADLTTHQRWWQFKLRDVESIWSVQGYHSNNLVMGLPPHLGRKGNCVVFRNPRLYANLDESKLFLALIDAIQTAKPDVKIYRSGKAKFE